MHRFVLLGFLLVPLVALAAGCVKPTKALPVATGPVELTDVSASDLETALDERKGKVVLVDFWATWCGPCRDRFPHFVETHNKYAGKGLVCLSVSLDTGDKQEVLDFLKENGASLPNYRLVDYQKNAVRVGRRFGLEGSIPFVALFNKAGKKVWDREQESLSDAALDRLIEAELAK